MAGRCQRWFASASWTWRTRVSGPVTSPASSASAMAASARSSAGKHELHPLLLQAGLTATLTSRAQSWDGQGRLVSLAISSWLFLPYTPLLSPHLIFQRLLCSCNRRVFPRGYPLAKTQGQRAIRQGTCARRWPPRSNPYTRDIQVRASQTVAPRAPGCLVKYRPLGPQIHYIASPTARPGAGNLMRWPDDTHEH